MIISFSTASPTYTLPFCTEPDKKTFLLGQNKQLHIKNEVNIFLHLSQLLEHKKDVGIMLNYKGVQKFSELYWFAILKHLTKEIFIVFLYLLYLPETESQLKKKNRR